MEAPTVITAGNSPPSGTSTSIQPSPGGPSSDLANATRNAAAYVGLYGMGKSLISVAAMPPTMMDGDPIRAILSDPESRKETVDVE